MSEEPEILYDVHAGVATVTLNRPARLNAVTPRMQRLLVERLAEADRDPGVRAVVLTGAGRGFCAGADLAVLDAALAGSTLDGPSAPEPSPLMDRPLRVSVPLVAAVNGPVAGMGFSWLLAADVRFASTEARIGATFPRLGLVAEWGAAWLLPRLVGSGHAADLLLSGRTVDAAEALAMGLVQRVLAPADLLPAARAWAGDVARNCSPRSTALTKAQLAAAYTQDLDVAYADSVRLMLESFGWPDLPAAMAARAERRHPDFPPYLPTALPPRTPSQEGFV